MISQADVERLLERFPGQNVLVVGDLMLDRYVWGSVNRISPEAPVPVVRVTREHALPGGAANVAVNIRALGGQAEVAGVVGRDRAAEELLDLLSSRGIGIRGVVRAEAVQTAVKTRVLAERQQVVRVDREGPAVLPGPAVGALCERLPGLTDGAAGVIIEDYGKGSVSQPVADTVMKCVGPKRSVVGFDPKDNHELRLQGITLATPNYLEACGAAGLPHRELSVPVETDTNLAEVGRRLLAKWDPDQLIITLGSHGMYLVERHVPPRVIPTRAREVFDVSGAGDTVIGAALLAIAAGASHYEAAALANCAAGVVVGKIGTATCSPRELLAAVT